MIERDFCEFLEYEICKAFEHSDTEEIKGFWCDGVLKNHPDSYYSKNYVNDHRQVILKALIGKDGQTEYELTLKFGNKALNRYSKNMDIKECMPNPEKQNWFYIDTVQNKIEIQLE